MKNERQLFKPLLFSVLLALLFTNCEEQQKATILTEFDRQGLGIQALQQIIAEDPRMTFEEIDVQFLVDENTTLKPEGFQIKRDGKQYQIVAKDSAGLLYGQLELAEQMRLYGWDGVQATTQNPYMELRGIKFNIPLDARTPSYTDASDVAQHNIPNVWEMSFWKEFIDEMASHRYNFVSLWSLHPFPSLVKVKGYEDVALDDVWRSTYDWEEYYHLHGTGLTTPEILENPEIVRKMTMADKIAFWREVMRYGKSRNVDFYFITWNIFDSGVNGKYGITDEIDNETTIDYFKQSIKAMFQTYPDLQGIGLTTGENMHRKTFEQKENWAYATYAEGMLEVVAEFPDRDFTFIHRQHQTGAKEIAEKFRPVIEQENVEFLYSFKYAKAHVFSALEQPYHEKFEQEIGDLKTIWTLRNDDAYYFRWGSPDYVRQFIKNIPYDISRGIYYGSDQWIWGRDFLTKDEDLNRQLELKKHWYHWMMWGRLGYDPNLPNERFEQLLSDKFYGVDAPTLFEAWQEASMVYPVTTGFHWGRVDFMWYIEGCRSRPKQAENESGFHDVNRFITLGTHPKAGYQDIPSFVENGKTDSLKTPFEVAEILHGHADRALVLFKELSAKDITNKELDFTLKDIQTIAFMGKYYAYKIEGATHLALYRANQKVEEQQKAVKSLTQALDYWKQYVASAMSRYKNPIWTNRVGYVDWEAMTVLVEKDIAIASQN